MVDTAPLTESEVSAAIQKRTIKVLMVGVIPAGAASSGAFAAAAILGKDITGSDTLGGLAAASIGLGAALATVPLAKLMVRRGRRIGIRTAFTLGSIGAVLCFFAAVTDTYFLLVPGAMAIGMGQTGTLASRYAAADNATESSRAQSIGVLLWAGAFGSALGPTLGLDFGGSVAEGIGLPELAGPYLLSVVLFATAATFTHKMLRPDPLELSGGMTGVLTTKRSTKDAFATIWARRDARLASAAMIAGHAVMVGVMTATPLHMKDGNHEIRIVGLVISLHTIGMFFFAPLVGKLVDRVGPKLVIAMGGGILFAGAELAAHTDAEHSMGVFTGLFLIGLGWSFGVVAASSLLTSSVPIEQRVNVQGTADLLMLGAGAAAGLIAGFVIENFSYHDLSHNAGLIGIGLTVLAVMSLLPARKARSTDSLVDESADAEVDSGV